jgi:hypothetical protein
MILCKTQEKGERLSNISHAIQTNVYKNQTAFPLCASM